MKMKCPSCGEEYEHRGIEVKNGISYYWFDCENENCRVDYYSIIELNGYVAYPMT